MCSGRQWAALGHASREKIRKPVGIDLMIRLESGYKP